MSSDRSSTTGAIDLRQQLDALLDQALELEGAARRDFVGGVEPPEVRHRLERLLGAADETLTFDERWPGVLGQIARRAGQPETPEPALGQVIGAWRLERVLGRGGMGTVFLARRCDGVVEMDAALKLSHRPFHGRQALGTDPQSAVARQQAVGRDRFERERQILARLEHPSIARFLDGGLTDDGRPYLVMERVVGEPIDQWCDARGLGIEERLRLFVELTRAVEAAHGNLVLHRDLKPSNILVNAAGQPKLLDFGIAKLIERGDDAETTRLMTPEYSTPEQFLGRPSSLATDVYQLGLLLYELLTGHQPQRASDESDRSLMELVCQHPALPPSRYVALRAEQSRVATPIASSTSKPIPPIDEVARRRGTSPHQLARRLRGDLDVIVGKALQKEPERRYASAGALAADIELHLRGRPITGRPDTFAYRAGKLLRRNRLSLGLLGLGFLALAIVVAAYTARLDHERQQALEARDQAEEARDASDQVVDVLVDLLGSTDAWFGAGSDVGALDLMRFGHQRALDDLADQPLVQARLLGTLGALFGRNASAQEGLPLLEEAVRLQQQHGSPLADLGQSQRHLAYLLARVDRLEESETYYLRAIEALDRAGETRLHGLALAGHGSTLRRLGRFEEAERVLRRALEIESTEHPDEFWHGEILARLGSVYSATARWDAAEAHLRAGLAMIEAARGVDHLTTASPWSTLGLVEAARGNGAAALELHRKAAKIYESHLGPDHRRTRAALRSTGEALRDLDRLDQADTVLARLHGACERSADCTPAERIDLLDSAALLARDRGDGDRATHAIREALDVSSRAFGEQHPKTLVRWTRLGQVFASLGRLAEARQAMSEAVAIAVRLDPSTGGSARYAYYALAEAGSFHGRLGRYAEPPYPAWTPTAVEVAEAERLLSRAIEVGVGAYGPEHAFVDECRQHRASLVARR